MSASAVGVHIGHGNLLAGARFLVGSSGTRYTPVEATLGSRTKTLPPASGKRWHVMQLTAAEAVAAAPDTLFKVTWSHGCHCIAFAPLFLLNAHSSL